MCVFKGYWSNLLGMLWYKFGRLEMFDLYSIISQIMRFSFYGNNKTIRGKLAVSDVSWSSCWTRQVHKIRFDYKLSLINKHNFAVSREKNMKLLPFIANRALKMEKVRLWTTAIKPYTVWHLVVLLWTASQSALMVQRSMFVHAHLLTLLFSAMFEYICLVWFQVDLHLNSVFQSTLRHDTIHYNTNGDERSKKLQTFKQIPLLQIQLFFEFIYWLFAIRPNNCWKLF